MARFCIDDWELSLDELTLGEVLDTRAATAGDIEAFTRVLSRRFGRPLKDVRLLTPSQATELAEKLGRGMPGLIRLWELSNTAK